MKKILVPFIFLCIILNCYSQNESYLKKLSHYIENTQVFQEGQEEGRAYFIPDNNILLNGEWKFYYSNIPEGIPIDFFNDDFDDKNWEILNVPSNWEMHGYGDKLFRNIGTSYSICKPLNAPNAIDWSGGTKPISKFTVTPPMVPKEYNPTGAYRKSFDLPKNWNDKEVFLRFEKIASASFVWVNGQKVGYNEGAQEPSEYNITEYLHEGKNTIAVLVLKFCDGYYLEGQDYWRLAGIFDDVWVYSTPKVRLFDWQVITDLDSQYINADLILNVNVKNYGQIGHFKVVSSLVKDGKVIGSIKGESIDFNKPGNKLITLTKTIRDPLKWTSETPNLYGLNIELLDSKNRVVDKINTNIGFKETDIKGNTFYLNGAPVKLNGINSHMQHPETGHYVDEATIRKDFELLKQFNFNTIRTSHYPPPNKYLELANEYGLYIIDETNDETHATTYMSQMSEYTEMYKERVNKMVLRDRNNPCVIFWSAGNESGDGENITEVITEGKRLDPTRYWMYGGNIGEHHAEDIIGPRYPSPIELEVNFGLDTTEKRPSFMDEYLAVTGNGCGGLDDLWRVVYSHPKIIGGAIWDFVSPGLKESVRRLEDKSTFNTPAHIMGNAKLVPGKTGNAIDLNGHDQWVEIYRANNAEVAGNQLTVTIDVFPRKLISSQGAFLTKGSNQFGIVQNGSDELVFYLFNGKRESVSAKLPENWENHWHNLVGLYNGENMKLFIDGKEAASKSVAGEIANLPFPINIGRDVEKNGEGTDVYICDALIDNVGIFAKVIEPGMKMDRKEAVLWLDFEKETNDGSFYSYGIGARTYGSIWPDRRAQPEMWQMKKASQPISCTLLDEESGTMEVWNRNSFLNTSFYTTNWTLTEDTTVIQSGTLDLDVKPNCRKNFKVPYTKPEIVPGKEYRLNISSQLKSNEAWADKNFEIAWTQVELKDWKLPITGFPESKSTALLDSVIDRYIVSGEGFQYEFDKTKGQLVSMSIDGKDLLISPITLNVWRAPLANETDGWNGIAFRNARWKDGYGSTISTDYYSNGIDRLKHLPIEITATQVGKKVVVSVRELALVDDGKQNFSQLDLYISGRTLSGFESTYIYTISGDGIILINHQVNPQGSLPIMLPRIGLTMAMNNRYSNVEWYGRGPQENYPDRKTGYRLGIYNSTVQDMYEPYLIPQDYGLRTDNRWLKMTDQNGKGIEFSMDACFNFNAYPFTTENLTNALYTYQLENSQAITLNLDYSTTGVGGTARPVMDSYRVYPKSYQREITIKPIR